MDILLHVFVHVLEIPLLRNEACESWFCRIELVRSKRSDGMNISACDLSSLFRSKDEGLLVHRQDSLAHPFHCSFQAPGQEFLLPVILDLLLCRHFFFFTHSFNNSFSF